MSTPTTVFESDVDEPFLWGDFDNETESPPDQAASGPVRLADTWAQWDPIDELLEELLSELRANGCVEQARAVKAAVSRRWTRVEIRGEGRHRYGFLPPGTVSAAGKDPAPVELPDGWDF